MYFFRNQHLLVPTGDEALFGTYRQLAHVTLQHSLQVQLLQFTLQAGRQPWVHGGTSGQDNVLVELSPGGPKERGRGSHFFP